MGEIGVVIVASCAFIAGYVYRMLEEMKKK